MGKLASLALGLIAFYMIVGFGLIDYIADLAEARESLQALIDAF